MTGRTNVLLGLATAWCRAEARVSRRAGRHAILDSVQRLSGAALAAALSRHEMSRLTLGIYDASPTYKDLAAELFALEEALIARELPRAPARVLVGACGAGREALALAARGYQVHAFDPAPAFVAESRRRLGAAIPVAQLSYEQLSAAVLDGAQPLTQERFDAVVLGCGSLSHVLQAHEQRRLFEALHVLCPFGPLVASFLWTDEEGGEAAFVGRAARWGGRIGRTLARLRGLSGDASPRLSYQAERGFAYTFTRREIERLARAVARRVVWEQDGTRPSLYATFVRG